MGEVPFAKFADTFVRNTFHAVGDQDCLVSQRALLDERARGASDVERALIAKLVVFLEAVSFPCESIRTGSHAFVDWGKLLDNFPWVECSNVIPILRRPQAPTAFLSLCHPTDSATLAFLGADTDTIQSVYLAYIPARMGSWESLLEVMKQWKNLQNVTFSSSFLKEGTAVVQLFVDNLNIKEFTFYGPVVKALKPGFFQNTHARRFSFPSTFKYLFEDCEPGDITAFFARLPAESVFFGAGPFFVNLLPSSAPGDLQPFVEALNSLSCTEVSLSGFSGVESSPEILTALFGGNFEKVLLDSASPELPIWPGFADLVADNFILESLGVKCFGKLASTVLKYSMSIRHLSFGNFQPLEADAGPLFYKECVLSSELVSLTCSSLNPEAEQLCEVFEKAREKTEQRARCLLFCCVQLAPTAHEHIVPSIGAVPIPVLREGVESAAERTAETVEKSPTVSEGKRESSWPDKQPDSKRR